MRLSPSGFFLLVITAAALTVGNLRQELVLTLLGVILLSVWTYCLVLGFVIALVYRKGALGIQVQISPRSIAAGTVVELVRRPGPRFFRVPGILVRYRLCLETRDGRRVEHVFDPGLQDLPLTIPLRGAYYSTADEFSVFDAFGIFDFFWPLYQGDEVRVLAGPRPAEESIPVQPRPGGREQHSGPHYRRSDDLVDHRPYIPGDDPRRINWKLYSHGPSNSLFVREGETEPPPRSRLLILVDTETDTLLYRPAAGRQAVDLLCTQALTMALDLAGRGMDVLIGCTGGKIRGGDAAELGEALAWPAALPVPASSLPAVPVPPLPGRKDRDRKRQGKQRMADNGMQELPLAADRGTFILALPRTTGGASALDRFLSRRAGGEAASPPCDIIFLYYSETGRPEDGPASPRKAGLREVSLRETAETCARLYGSRNALRARALGLEYPANAEPSAGTEYATDAGYAAGTGQGARS
jgi:hypothetical protein